MSANVASSAAPPWAVKVWADDLNVYAEVSSINQPAVVSAAFTEGGLSRILTVLSAKHQSESAGQQYLRPAVVAKHLMKQGLTQEDLDSAARVLEGLGILKPRIAKR